MLVAIGVCDGFNGLLTVFSGSATRVPAELQPFLLQLQIPMYIVCSKRLLGASYSTKQLFGAVLVMVAVVVTLIPSFNSVNAPSISWAFILVAGIV